MQTIVVAIHLPRQLLASLEGDYHVVAWPEEGTMPKEQVLAEISKGNVVAIVCSSSLRVDRALLEASGEALKVISTVSVGLDHIDVDECHRRGIILGYTPDVLSDAVAELTLALLLATTRRLMLANRLAITGQWPRAWGSFYHTAGQIKNSVVGVIGGSGRVGQAIIKRLNAFEPSRVLYHGTGRRPEVEAQLGCSFATLPELLATADFVIISVSLNAQTRRLIGAEQLGLMKPTATLVNISRGAVVDQAALTEALRAGTIRAAGLDVFEKEPIDPNDPLVSMDNVVILPHIGSATMETRTAMIELGIDNLKAALEGKPLPAPVPL